MGSFAGLNCKLVKRYDDWMIAMHYATGTRICYNRTLRMFKEFLGEKSIASVNHLEIRQFITRISQEGASPQSTYLHLNVLRQFYDFLSLGGIVNYVAPRLIKLRRPQRNLPPLLSEYEIQKLIVATRTLRERALIETFYGTGCRLKEVTHMKVEDIDFVGRTARVMGKGSKSRVVLLTEGAINAITAYLDGRSSGYVFREDRPVPKGCLSSADRYWMGVWRPYGKRGRKCARRSKSFGSVDLVSYETARMKFDKILERVNLRRPYPNRPLTNVGASGILRQLAARAGLKRISAHMLRRSFATHLSDHGAGLEMIQALMGHVFIQTTARYTRLSSGRLVNAFKECHPRDRMNVEKQKDFEQSQTKPRAQTDD
jgi:integrase/recombinase XerD